MVTFADMVRELQPKHVAIQQFLKEGASSARVAAIMKNLDEFMAAVSASRPMFDAIERLDQGLEGLSGVSVSPTDTFKCKCLAVFDHVLKFVVLADDDCEVNLSIKLMRGLLSLAPSGFRDQEVQVDLCYEGHRLSKLLFNFHKFAKDDGSWDFVAIESAARELQAGLKTVESAIASATTNTAATAWLTTLAESCRATMKSVGAAALESLGATLKEKQGIMEKFANCSSVRLWSSRFKGDDTNWDKVAAFAKTSLLTLDVGSIAAAVASVEEAAWGSGDGGAFLHTSSAG